MIRVIDHNEKEWRAKYDSQPGTNGGYAYSVDIVKYHLPIIKRIVKNSQYKNALIGTCDRLAAQDDMSPELVIQYLHRYPARQADVDADWVSAIFKGSKVIFITAYFQQHCILTNKGYNSIWAPMMVDPDETKGVSRQSGKRFGKGKAIYFGNIRGGDKQATHDQVVGALAKLGWKVDTISDNKLNGRSPELTHKEILEVISQYEYGIGTGRCALEIIALGLKVLIAGNKIGGIMINDEDWEVQRKSNLNTYAVTFGRTIEACMECIDMSIAPKIDYKESLAVLADGLSKQIIA
jgi:hypothetical protein